MMKQNSCKIGITLNLALVFFCAGAMTSCFRTTAGGEGGADTVAKTVSRKDILDAKRKATAEKKAAHEAEQKARDEARQKVAAEKKAKAEAERKARDEARTKAEAEKKAKLEAERKERDAAVAKRVEEQRKSRDARRIEELEKRKAALQAKLDIKPASSGSVTNQPGVSAGLVGGSSQTGGWKIGAGVMRRHIGKTTFKTKSYSPSYPIANKSGDSIRRGSVGSDSAIEDRVYANGYVGKDYWTDLDGGTWNWGYDDAGQVNNNMVVMDGLIKSVTSFKRSSSEVSGDWEKSSDNEAGVFVEAEKVLNSRGSLDYGLVINASRASFSAEDRSETFRDKQIWNVRDFYVQDSYDISGTGITPATPPYQGTEAGPGPQINNVPSGRQVYSRIRSSGSYEVVNSAAGSFDMDLSTISLGLSARKNIRWFNLSGSAGPTFNIVEKEARYEEILFESINGGPLTPLCYWNDTDNDNEYIFGGYVQGALGLKLVSNLELSLFGRYDWLENISGNVGLSSYESDPSGGSFGGMLNFLF